MKYAWVTDIHLDFLEKEQRQEFYKKINNCGAQIILVTGDISNATLEGRDVIRELNQACRQANQFMCFVLGNHDYYGTSIDERRSEFENQPHDSFYGYLSWLNCSAPLIASEDTIIVGVDGWADGRYGDFERARKGTEMNDHRHIWDFAELGDPANTRYGTFKECQEAKKRRDYAILKKRQELADMDAATLEQCLLNVLKKKGGASRIIILTHVPPFPEVCKYDGRPTSEGVLPYYSCKATGDVIMKYAKEYPDVQFLVLCGHTHGKAEYQPLDNLLVKAGDSQYRKPTIQEVFE